MTLDLEQPGMGERPSSGMQRRPRPGMEPERWWRPWLVLSQRAPKELTLRAAPATQSAPSERQRIQAGPAAGQCGTQQWVGGAEAGAAISCEQQRGLAPEAVSERCLGACTGRPWDVSLHMRPTCLNTSFLWGKGPGAGKQRNTRLKGAEPGASLVDERLRTLLSMQGMWVQILVQEGSTCHRVAESIHHNFWAHALQPDSHSD